jgi:phosphoribosylformylglycinamidine synthase
MMGLFKNVEKRVTQWFKNDADPVYLLGEIGDAVGGSRYLQIVHGLKTGLCPRMDLEKENNLYQFLIQGADQEIFQSAHDCSDGGFAVALAECCFTGATHEQNARGVKVSLPGQGRPDGRLFGEAQSRVIVSCKPAHSGQLEKLAQSLGVPFTQIGKVGGDSFEISGILQAPVGKLGDLFFTAIEKMMS